MSILSVFFITGCGGGGGDGGGGNVPVTTTINPVSSTIPVDGAAGVPIGNRLTVTFNEEMDPATINTTTFTLAQGGTAVSGTVAYTGITAVFGPAANLIANTTYVATITTGAKNLAGYPLENDYVWSFTTAAAADTTAPTVTLTDPANNKTGVALNKKIAATFDEPMNPLTITTTTFTLNQGAKAVSGTVTYAGVTATFAPASNLAASTTYTATITTGAEDLAGNAITADKVWSFTTGAAADTTAPTVTLTDPANNKTGVALNKKITATFDEGMDPLTITTKTFTLKLGATAVSGTVTYAGVTATFTPASNLATSTTYTATITTGAKDLAGNAIAANKVWNFTTGAAADTTAPTVTSVDPVNNETGVVLNKKIAATFDEAMDPLTITTTTFALRQGATAISGTVAYTGVTAVFTPDSNLAANTTYTATVTSLVEDLAGNAMVANKVWSFTTGAAADTTAPTATSVDPANSETGVALNKKIIATFDEGMDPLTITTKTFILNQGVTAVSGTVTYAGVTATFTPDSNLAASTTYTATITTGAKDLAGNAIVANEVWNFTTGAALDTTAPTIISTSPADTDTGVILSKKVQATFDEAMDPLTITKTTFTLKKGAITVSGTVTYAGVTATFTPDSDLAASTTYTATITTGAEDLVGNAMAANEVWNFTTGAAPDTTAPTVMLTDPVDIETGVALNKKIAATFDEAMDPLTITTTTFTLNQGVTAVSGTVTYAGVTATFTPDSDLAASTTYTATITTGAKDLAGNAIAANKVWNFTTGAAPDTTAPTITSTSPADTDTGVILSKKLQATFDEAMDPLTISTLTFTLKDNLSAPVSGAVTYVGIVATFTPDSNLASSTTYTATVNIGAKDLAGNAMAADKVWSFTTLASVPLGPAAVDLGTSGDFAILTKSGITTTGATAITGDIAVSPISSTAITGFGEAMDPSNQFSTSPLVTGKIYASDYAVPTPAKATAAISDLHTAYIDAAGRTTPDGTELYAGNLTGQTFAPGLYKWSTGISVDAFGVVTLNGGANDVWIFQIAGNLTMNSGASVALTGGAQAKNIFWQVSGGTGVTFEVGAAFKGNILASKAIVFKSGATLVSGRALAETNVTLIANTITKP